jgi:hypothetical protein
MKSLNNKETNKMLSECIKYIINNIKKLEEFDDDCYKIYHKRNDSTINVLINDQKIVYYNYSCSFTFNVVGEHSVDFQYIKNELKRIKNKNVKIDDDVKVNDNIKVDKTIIKDTDDGRVFVVQTKRNKIFEMTDKEIYKEVKFSENFNREFKKLEIGQEMYNYDLMIHFKRIK